MQIEVRFTVYLGLLISCCVQAHMCVGGRTLGREDKILFSLIVCPALDLSNSIQSVSPPFIPVHLHVSGSLVWGFFFEVGERWKY